MEINDEIIQSMMKSLEKYPGVLPLHIFLHGPWLLSSSPRGDGYNAYMNNLEDTGLLEKLHDEFIEARHKSNRLPFDQLDCTIVEWVDKLQNHPEQLSDAEREWVKNNPDYKKIVINE